MEMPLILFGILSLIFALKSTKQLNSVKNLLFVSLSGFFGTLSLRSVNFVVTKHSELRELNFYLLNVIFLEIV